MPFSRMRIPVFVVELTTPKGQVGVNVPTLQGSAAASRRAFWALVANGYGDVDEVRVISVRPDGEQEESD